jgi:lipoprotein-anchoring transpeptidase ErfK/SrfK
MKRATLVAATLCVFASAGATFAQDPVKLAEAAPPTIAAVSAPTLAPAAVAVEVPTAAVKPTPPPPPPVSLVAKVDLSTQRLTLTENGKVKHSWPISSGAQGFATPTGNFKPEWTAKMWYSRKYDMAPMPHAVFFKNGAAIHATQATGSLGSPASHGCVRLAPSHAATFYGLVQRHGLVHTRINVIGTPRYHKPSHNAVASRQQPARQRYASTSSSQSGYFASPAPQIQYRQVRYVPTAYRY